LDYIEIVCYIASCEVVFLVFFHKLVIGADSTLQLYNFFNLTTISISSHLKIRQAAADVDVYFIFSACKTGRLKIVVPDFVETGQ
jgi:hypothetical protein